MLCGSIQCVKFGTSRLTDLNEMYTCIIFLFASPCLSSNITRSDLVQHISSLQLFGYHNWYVNTNQSSAAAKYVFELNHSFGKN